MDLAVRGDRVEDLQACDGDPGEAEQREALGQRDRARLAAQPRACRRSARDGVRLGDARAQPSPQVRLPMLVFTGRPGADQPRSVQRVAVEQSGEVADGREPPRPIDGQMGGERRQPRLAQRVLEHFEQRPHEPLGEASGSASGSIRDAAATASPVSRCGNGNSTFAQIPSPTEHHQLREPSLHPARRDADDLGRERVVRRAGEQGLQGHDEPVGAVGSVDVEHRQTPGRRAVPGPDRSMMIPGTGRLARRWAGWRT